MEEGENTQKGKMWGGLLGLLAGAAGAYATYGAVTSSLATAGGLLSTSAAGIISIGSFALPAFIGPIAVAGLAAAGVLLLGKMIGSAIGTSIGAAKDQQQAAAQEASLAQGRGLERGMGGVEPTLSAGVQKEAPAVNNNLPSMDLPRGQETNEPEAPTKSFVKMEDARRAGRNAPNSAITYETAMMR